MPRLHVLGSGGWVPTLARQTCCYLLETRRGLVFFDCGTGISRLHDPLYRELLRRHRRALVLLSHWHQDHIEGLHALPLFLGHMEVIVGAPPRALTGFDPRDVLGRYGGKPFLPTPLPDWDRRFDGGFRIEELAIGRNEVMGETVEVIGQPHSDPSAGFRVRDVCYLTDTVERPESAAFATKAALLIHDAWLDRAGAAENPDEAAWHASAEGAARVAAQAGAQDLLLAHLNPAYEAARLDHLVFEAAALFPRSLLATDMMSLRLADPAEEAAKPAAAEGAGPEGAPEPEAGDQAAPA